MKRTSIAALIIVATCALGTARPKEWSFPNTKQNGRATVEYQHEGVHAVINYDYSQRNHNTKWLLIDLAAGSKRRFVLHKNHIRVLTPEGRELPVAPQQAVIDDSPGITFVLQNARIFRHRLDDYLPQRNTAHESILFQVAPPGAGTTSDEAIVDGDRVTAGALFFSTPEGQWQPGTYRLEINNEVANAALPIRLE
jgi:hypothetical protein